MPERGQIVDYEISESVSTGVLNSRVGTDIVPLLVVTADPDTEVYSGFAFLPDGTSHYVTVSPESPEQDPSASWKFDPETGRPIGPARFDSQTGEPLNPDGTVATPPPADNPPPTGDTTPADNGGGTDPGTSASLPTSNPASPAFSAETPTSEGGNA